MLPLSVKVNRDEKLGRGSFGVVFGGTLDGEEVAVKRIQLFDLNDTEEIDGAAASSQSSSSTSPVKREFDALRSFNHPHVLKFFCAYEDDDFKYFVLERCAATLSDYFRPGYSGPIPPPGRIGLHQMATGVNYIHSQRFVHRDIKPGNILISKEGQLKISDFGFCKPANERGSFSANSGFRGSKHFTAPELLRLVGGVGQMRGTIKCDIFSLGCVFFAYLTVGGHPFASNGGGINDLSIPSHIEKNIFDLSRLDAAEFQFARGMVESMIQHDPVHRTDLERVIQVLESA